jgi:hypothetical protein
MEAITFILSGGVEVERKEKEAGYFGNAVFWL